MAGLKKPVGVVVLFIALIVIFITRTVRVASLVTRGFHQSGSAWWVNLALTLALAVGIVAVLRAGRLDWQRRKR